MEDLSKKRPHSDTIPHEDVSRPAKKQRTEPKEAEIETPTTTPLFDLLLGVPDVEMHEIPESETAPEPATRILRQSPSRDSATTLAKELPIEPALERERKSPDKEVSSKNLLSKAIPGPSATITTRPLPLPSSTEPKSPQRQPTLLQSPSQPQQLRQAPQPRLPQQKLHNATNEVHTQYQQPLQTQQLQKQVPRHQQQQNGAHKEPQPPRPQQNEAQHPPPQTRLQKPQPQQLQRPQQQRQVPQSRQPQQKQNEGPQPQQLSTQAQKQHPRPQQQAQTPDREQPENTASAPQRPADLRQPDQGTPKPPAALQNFQAQNQQPRQIGSLQGRVTSPQQRLPLQTLSLRTVSTSPQQQLPGAQQNRPRTAFPPTKPRSRTPSPERKAGEELEKEVELQSNTVAVKAMKNQLLNKALTGQSAKSPKKEYLCRDCKMPFTRRGDREYAFLETVSDRSSNHENRLGHTKWKSGKIMALTLA